MLPPRVRLAFDVTVFIVLDAALTALLRGKETRELREHTDSLSSVNSSSGSSAMSDSSLGPMSESRSGKAPRPLLLLGGPTPTPPPP